MGWKAGELVSLRSDKEMHDMFDGLVPRNKTLDNVIDDLIEDTRIRDTILTFEPKKLHKKQMVKYLKDNFAENPLAFSGFARTISDIETFFCK